MRWFKVRWPAEVLFQERGEIELASGLLQASDVSAVVRVWAVGGHVFCIESDKSLKAFRTATNASFVPTVRPNPSLQPTRASCAGLVG